MISIPGWPLQRQVLAADAASPVIQIVWLWLSCAIRANYLYRTARTLLHELTPILAVTAANASGVALFYLFAAMAGASAIGVVACRNIVRASVCLLFTLAGVAGLYFLLNAEFLAAVQLVVYTGGILIIIIFGVMLTSTSPFSRFEPKISEVIVALSIGVILFTALLLVAVRSPFPMNQTAGSAPASIETFGQLLLGDFIVPFEFASVLLLVVMIGAAYVARGRRGKTATVLKSE